LSGCQAAFGRSWNSPPRAENCAGLHLGQFRHRETGAAPARAAFDSVRARLLFESDVFWARASIGHEMLELWLDTYQTSRSFRKRGIVELELP